MKTIKAETGGRRREDVPKRLTHASISANEMSCLDSVLRILAEGEESVALFLDGERDTLETLATLEHRGLIRFVLPLSEGMPAIVSRPSRAD